MTIPGAGQGLNWISAAEAAAAIRSGTLTSRALVTACLERIAERDGTVRAWAYLDPDLVLAQADAADAVPLAARGPLHGVPVGVKDIILTRDMPTQMNSPHFAGHFPPSTRRRWRSCAMPGR